MNTKQLFLTGALALGTAAPASAGFVYQLDDGGSPNTGISPVSGGTVVNRYQSVGGFDTIIAVQARIFAISTGSYNITASVWTDPTGGNPSDATLLTTTQQTFAISGDGFVTIDLNSPTNIGPAGSWFFVGLTLEDDNLLLAVDSGSSGTYFQQGSEQVPSSLHNASFLPAGAAFIRGIATPAPLTSAVLGMGGLLATKRRRH